MNQFELEVRKKKRNGISLGQMAKLFDVTKQEFNEWFKSGYIPEAKVKEVEAFFELSKRELLVPLTVEIPVSLLSSIVNEGKSAMDQYRNNGSGPGVLLDEIESNVDVAREFLIKFHKQVGIHNE